MSFFSKAERRKSEINIDPHQWELPTNFRSWGFNSSSRKPTVIPSQSIFRDVFIPYLEITRDNAAPSLVQYPTAGQLAVHLCLIGCFINFKKQVESANTFEDVDPPSYAIATNPDSKARAPPSTSETSSLRWDTAVRLAVERFKVWFEKIEGVLRHASFYNRLGTSSHDRGAFSKDYLPPLDVLLVWYAYMTQPAAYKKDNLAHSTQLLLDVCFPWDSLLQVINQDKMEYTLPVPAQNLFTTLTTQSPDLLTYLSSPPAYTDPETQRAISLDLTSLVHDQMPFFNHIHSLLWIRSPALEGTLHRALAEYGALSSALTDRCTIWTGHVSASPGTALTWRTHMFYPILYQRFCTRTFPSESTMPSPTPYTDVQASCACWTCEAIRDHDAEYSRPMHNPGSRAMPNLPPSVTQAIRADLAFYRHVEACRTRDPAAPLPTRAPTEAELARAKDEQDKIDRVGRFYGLGYTVETVAAVYDLDGRLVRPEKTRVRRSQNGIGLGGMMFF